MRKKKVERARSKSNGIVFYSSIFPRIGTEAIIDDDGKISSRVIFDTIEYDFWDQYAEAIKKRFFDKKKIGIINLTIITIASFSRNIAIILAAMFFTVVVSKKLLGYIEHFFNIKKGKEYELGKMHAAEHKVVNAYIRLQRIPNLEELRKESRFSIECGSRKMFREIFGKLIITFLIAMAPKFGVRNSILLIEFMVILYMVGSILGVFKYLQILVTNQPSDKELEVAIEAIKKFDELEKKLDSEVGMDFIEDAQLMFLFANRIPKGKFSK